MIDEHIPMPLLVSHTGCVLTSIPGAFWPTQVRFDQGAFWLGLVLTRSLIFSLFFCLQYICSNIFSHITHSVVIPYPPYCSCAEYPQTAWTCRLPKKRWKKISQTVYTLKTSDNSQEAILVWRCLWQHILLRYFPLKLLVMISKTQYKGVQICYQQFCIYIPCPYIFFQQHWGKYFFTVSTTGSTIFLQVHFVYLGVFPRKRGSSGVVVTPLSHHTPGPHTGCSRAVPELFWTKIVRSLTGRPCGFCKFHITILIRHNKYSEFLSLQI